MKENFESVIEPANRFDVIPGLEKLEQRVRDQIITIKDIIVKTIPVECIYLFGSYAYGVPNEDSDIDLFVVMDDDAPYEAIEAEVMIHHAMYGKKSMPTDILVNKNSRFQYRKTGPTLEQEVAEKGIIIYE